MEEKNFISEEFKEKLLEHSAELANFFHAYQLFRYCIENEAYMKNSCEICCFGVILEKYIEQIKTKLQNFENEYGIY